MDLFFFLCDYDLNRSNFNSDLRRLGYTFHSTITWRCAHNLKLAPSNIALNIFEILKEADATLYMMRSA